MRNLSWPLKPSKNGGQYFKSERRRCLLRLGNGDEVRALLGEPDAIGGTSRKNRMPAIRYEEMEFRCSPCKFNNYNDLLQVTRNPEQT